MCIHRYIETYPQSEWKESSALATEIVSAFIKARHSVASLKMWIHCYIEMYPHYENNQMPWLWKIVSTFIRPSDFMASLENVDTSLWRDISTLWRKTIRCLGYEKLYPHPLGQGIWLLSLKMWIHCYKEMYPHYEWKQSDALAMKNCIHIHQAKWFYGFPRKCGYIAM